MIVACDSKIIDDGYDGEVGEFVFESLDGEFFGDTVVVGSADFALSGAYGAVDGGDKAGGIYCLGRGWLMVGRF